MKIYILLITLFIAQSGYAFEYTSNTNNTAPLLKIKVQIEDVSTSITNLKTLLATAAACGDNGQHFNGTSCVNLTEQDPETEIHGKRDMILTCSAGDQAQSYDTSTNTWTCKTLTN